MAFPENVDIYIQIGYSSSKKYDAVIDLMKTFPNYCSERLCKTGHTINSCHFVNTVDYLFFLSDIEFVLFVADSWKSFHIFIDKNETNYNGYINYRCNLVDRFPDYRKLFNTSNVANDVCSLEKLPYPFVYYPRLYGGFFAFSPDINAPFYFCSCQKQAIENYIKVRSKYPLRNRPYTSESLLATDFFPSTVSEYAKGYHTMLMDNLHFKDHLCFKCNYRLPRLSYCSSMYGTSFMQKHGWYVMQKYFELGIDYFNIRSNIFTSLYCDETLQNHLSVYDQLRSNNHDDEACHEQLSLIRNYVEDLVRIEFGYPKKGEGWISETTLYYLICDIYPNSIVKRHFRPKWLSGLELDIFLPEKNLALEYQGIQHYKPVAYWGGDYQLSIQQKNDAKKSIHL